MPLTVDIIEVCVRASTGLRSIPLPGWRTVALLVALVESFLFQAASPPHRAVVL